MKVNIVNYSQVIAQLFTMLTLGYSVKVKLVKRFTMYTLVELFNVKLVKRFTKWTFKTLSIGISYQILKAY